MTDENPLKPYIDAASEVVGTYGAKAGTDGDPQTYGRTYSRLVGAYLDGVLSVRPLGQADVHVLDVLRACAFMVSGGVQAQRFRDIVSAGLAGSVHVEQAIATLQAAQNRQNEPRTAADRFMEEMNTGKPVAAEEPPEEPDDGHGFKPADVPSLSDEDKALLDRFAAEAPMPHVEDAPAFADDDARLNAFEDQMIALQAKDADDHEDARDNHQGADEERASDADLLRWVLTPGSDPWGDLLEEAPEGASPGANRALRPGVTQLMVQARFDRLHGLLDTSKAPEGVKPEVWEAAKARALPVTFGDRGTA